MMKRTRGLSPKIIAPIVGPLSAFIAVKVEDPSTEALLIALVAAIGLYFAPPGDVTVTDDGAELDGYVDAHVADELRPVQPSEAGLTP